MEAERGTTAAREDMGCTICTGSDASGASGATTQSLSPSRTCKQPLGGSVHEDAVGHYSIRFRRCASAHYH